MAAAFIRGSMAIVHCLMTPRLVHCHFIADCRKGKGLGQAGAHASKPVQLSRPILFIRGLLSPRPFPKRGSFLPAKCHVVETQIIGTKLGDMGLL